MLRLFIILFLPFIAIAQKGYVMGKVMDKQRNLPIELAMVQNLRNKASTKTDAKGNFFILTQARDTLEFYGMGFKKTYLVATKTIKDTTIALTEDARQLQEVVIKGTREQTLKKDIAQFNTEPTATMKIEAEDILVAAVSPGALYELLSGDLKKQKRAAVERQKYIRNYLVRLRYNKALAQHITKLPDTELEDFMQFCDVPAEMVLHLSDYDLHHEILQCFSAYQERKKSK